MYSNSIALSEILNRNQETSNIMATARNTGRIIEPWSGSGWPLSLFVDQRALTEKRIYFCSRTDCGQINGRILREPWQLTCGHRLCKECFDFIQTLPEDQRECYACKDEPYDIFDDVRTDQAVLAHSMAVTTDHMVVVERSETEKQQQQQEQQLEPRFCKIDSMKAMKDNAANRELNRMLVNCPYECGTGSELTIRTIDKHMNACEQRLVPCEKCAEVIRYSQIAEHAANTCPLRPADCPNRCGKEGLKGNELTKHLAECEKRPPMCNICKNSYEYNEDAHDHLMKCVTKCPLNCSQSSEDVNIVKHLCSEHLMGEHLLLLSLFIDAENADKSPGDSSSTGVAQTQLLTDPESCITQESASGLPNNARLAEKNRIDLNDLEALFKVLARDVHMLTSYDTAFRSLEDRTKKLEVETDDHLNKLETLSNVRIAEIEDQKITLHHLLKTVFNGNLFWKIDRVQQRRDEAHVKRSIYSHPFYTEVYGYKMCARIYFNGDGDGKNTHISLFFVVMKGEYDALLPWPFQQKVTMKLRNQTKKKPDVVEKFRPEPSSSSFQRPKNEMNIASGCPQFAEQSHVFSKENGFVVDDTIFIEISVDNAYEALHDLNISVQDMTRSFTSAGGK